MLFAILAFWWGYKKAKATGRNAFLWSVVCGGTFIGVQILVGIGAGIFLAVGTQLWGWNDNILEKYSWGISFAAVIPAVIAIMLIFRYLDRIPDEPVLTAPPPPPTFSGVDADKDLRENGG